MPTKLTILKNCTFTIPVRIWRTATVTDWMILMRLSIIPIRLVRRDKFVFSPAAWRPAHRARPGRAVEQAAAIDDATLLEIYNQALEQNPELAKQFQTNQPAASGKLTEIENKATSATEALNTLSGISASEVRKLLLEQGFSEAELKLIGDEELMKIYQEALDQAGKGVKE